MCGGGSRPVCGAGEERRARQALVWVPGCVSWPGHPRRRVLAGCPGVEFGGSLLLFLLPTRDESSMTSKHRAPLYTILYYTMLYYTILYYRLMSVLLYISLCVYYIVYLFCFPSIVKTSLQSHMLSCMLLFHIITQ